MLPEFDLLTPRTLTEALEMMSEGAPYVVPVAGGTNVIVELRERRQRHRVLMDVSRLGELRGIRRQGEQIVVGGGTTMSELLTHPLIAECGAPLRESAATLGSPLVRNRATVAGNLVDASPAADTAPPLLVLDAEVELMSLAGARHILLNDFIVGPNETVILPQELLVAVRWPVPSDHSVAAFHKIGLRKAQACSVISAAVALERNGDGRCGQARIALGAVAPRPMRVETAEALLCAEPLTPVVIAEAARLATGATRPLDDVRATADYRRRAVEALVRRLLTGTLDFFRDL